MKKSMYRVFVVRMAVFVSLLFLYSCSGNKDKEIQTAIEAKKKENQALAGMVTSVKDGVVTISGECGDAAGKELSESMVKSIPGVKQVINNCNVSAPPAPEPAPVTITADDPLSKNVTDATKDFPGVQASVKDGVITLTGEIKRSDLPKLMQSLHTLKPKKIENQLTIK